MEKLQGIRACVFDAYGTLFDVAGPVAKLAGEIGPHAEDISKLWRQKQLEYSWLRSLMGVHGDFWHVTGDALDYALEQFDVKLDAYPEVADALAAVKAKGKLTAILSNGSPSMLDAAVRHAGLDKLFNMVLSVEDVGIYKPSRRVYRHAMQKLQIHEAPSICFVTSNTWDSHGAAQFGFQVVRVDRFGLKDDRLPGKPAALVKDLGELAGIV